MRTPSASACAQASAPPTAFSTAGSIHTLADAARVFSAFLAAMAPIRRMRSGVASPALPRPTCRTRAAAPPTASVKRTSRNSPRKAFNASAGTFTPVGSFEAVFDSSPTTTRRSVLGRGCLVSLIERFIQQGSR